MSTPASVNRHPVHPMLIPLPIGLWVFSLVSDIIFRAGWGGGIWNSVAVYTIAGGIVGALLAAVPGFMDLLSIDNPKVKKIGLWHMSLNLLAVVVYAINLWLRMPSTLPPASSLPVWLSVLGIVIICISGWLGGEMVYVHRVGVEREPRR